MVEIKKDRQQSLVAHTGDLIRGLQVSDLGTAVECGECYGRGVVEAYPDTVYEECVYCAGDGWFPIRRNSES